MAAPMTFRRVLCRFKSFCRHRIDCKKYATASVATPEPKTQEPVPWEDRPVGKLLFLSDHPQFMFKFEDALKMHKEAAQPEMGNNLQALIYADMILDFTTKKVTKPMKHSVDIIRFPHNFESGQKNNFMVLSESEETLELAKSLGALICGGTELIEQLLLGRVHKDDIINTDFVLATPGIISKLGQVRSILKLKFPTSNSGTIGEDIKAMMDKLNEGLRYSTDKTPVSLGARVQIPFGQLYQEDEILAENFDFMIQHLFNKKRENLTPYVNEVTLIAPPSEERFLLNMKYITRKPIEKPALTTDKADIATPESDSSMANVIGDNVNTSTEEPIQSVTVENTEGETNVATDQSETVEMSSEIDEPEEVEQKIGNVVEESDTESGVTEEIKAEAKDADEGEKPSDSSSDSDDSSDSSDDEGSSSDEEDNKDKSESKTDEDPDKADK